MIEFRRARCCHQSRIIITASSSLVPRPPPPSITHHSSLSRRLASSQKLYGTPSSSCKLYRHTLYLLLYRTVEMREARSKIHFFTLFHNFSTFLHETRETVLKLALAITPSRFFSEKCQICSSRQMAASRLLHF